MKLTEDPLRQLLDRHLPSPSPLELTASHDRLLHELRSTPPRLQRPRIAEAAPSAASSAPWWRPVVALAAAAALIVIVSTVSFQRDWLATVEAADGSRYPLAPNEVLRLRDGDAMLTLTDGSRVEMRSQAELSLEREPDGLGIRLRAGDIIVDAARQRDGHLYVHTRDMTVAVAGTVFLVNAATDGSRVAVIEGEVRVRQRGTPLRRSGRPGDVETHLRPGEEVATSPTIARRPVTEDITWSRNANVHLALLESFRKGMAQTAGTLTPVNPSQAGTPATPATPASPAGRAEFEEASIRTCDPDNLPPTPAGARGGGANSFQMSPGRLYGLCLTPATLIRTAYGYTPAAIDFNPARGGRVARGMNVNIVYGLGVEDGLRVRGGPDWVRNTHYTIEAVAGTPADAETMRGPMLVALLERRFGLKTHIETEQIQAFALTLAPGGLKLKEGTCAPPAVPPVPGAGGSTADGVRRNLDAARRGETTIGPCGFGGAVNGPNLIFVGAGTGVPPLGGFLGVPVIDRTGVPPTTRFNYVLEFKPDDRTPGMLGRIPDLPAMQIAPDPSAVPAAPDLFTVLEQQFGLRLEPAQAPREFIVIDAIERPGAN